MDIIINGSLNSKGDPNGVVDAPKSSLFYKTGSFYKINYTGSYSTNWQNVFVRSFGIPNFAVTVEDLKIQAVETGSFFYVKTTNEGNLQGWVLLANKTPFIPSK